MGLQVVGERAARLITMLALAAVGCQQGATPVQLSVVGDEGGDHHMSASADPGLVGTTDLKDTPYTNDSYRDDDVGSSNIAWDILTGMGGAVQWVFSPIVDTTAHSIQWLSGDRPIAADRLLEDKSSADHRREGMNKLAEFGFLSNPLFEKRCRQLAQYDVDFTVRASAIRTGNRARDSKATSVFILGLSDQNEWVRLESAKALANVPDSKAVEPLIRLLADHDQSKDIRIAAADALKHYRTQATARALAATLHDKSFAIAWQAHRSLKYLTSRDFGYEESAWLNYVGGSEKPWG
jgi:hypothetical protein